MYVHWREREHEEIDSLVTEDPADLIVLEKYRLLNVLVD
jgi:hypothetical protein